MPTQQNKPEVLDQFLEIPAQFTDFARARYAILPVPYEGTVSFGKGTGDGPAAILSASQQVENFDEELHSEFYEAGIATCAAVEPACDVAEEMERVLESARSIVKANKFMLALGGEHSISPPLVKAVIEHHGPVSVLQIDAHADLRDTYDDTPHSHACAMRRILELTPQICQVGIRNFSREEYEQCPEQVKRFVTPAVIQSDPTWIERVISMLGEKVYITIDIDGIDPAYAPGTGTPEPGGMNWMQVTKLLRQVCTRRKVVAADIVEVAPIAGQHTTEFLAARLAYKIIAYTQLPAVSGQ